MTKPPVTHKVTVYYRSGPMTFRGTHGYVREIRASAIEDGTAVSGITVIGTAKSRTNYPQARQAARLLARAVLLIQAGKFAHARGQIGAARGNIILEEAKIKGW